MKKRTKEITKIFGEVLGAVLALSLAFSTNVYATSDDIVSDAQIEDLMNTDTINEISDKVDDIGEQISNLSDAASENDSSEDEDSDNSGETIENQIDNLNNDYANLQKIFGSFTQNYEVVLNSILNYKLNVIEALNSNIFANDNIPSDTSYADTISIIKNISAPATATGNYYASGSNSGLGVGLSASSPSANVDIDGVTSLDLGINEALTLPSGYYPNDISIQNSVINRGTLNWAPTSNTSYTIPSGYYEGGTLSTGNVYKTAYDFGYSKGKSDGYSQGNNDGYNKGKAAAVPSFYNKRWEWPSAEKTSAIRTATYTAPANKKTTVYFCWTFGDQGTIQKQTVSNGSATKISTISDYSRVGNQYGHTATIRFDNVSGGATCSSSIQSWLAAAQCEVIAISY